MPRSTGSFLAIAGLLIVVLGAFTPGTPQAMWVGFAVILTGLVFALEGRNRQ